VSTTPRRVRDQCSIEHDSDLELARGLESLTCSLQGRLVACSPCTQ